MRVEWFKLDQADSTVHLYADHKDNNKEQDKSYQGRTALFKEELQKGNTSLKLSDIQVSDNGLYKCSVRSRTYFDDITVKIVVEVTGSNPVITMEELDILWGFGLVCESKGWNPEPVIEWLDSEGAILNTEVTQTRSDSEGYSVKCSVIVFNSQSNRLFCRVKQGLHMKETEVIISVIEKRRAFRVDVTMDINTAHPYLNLSADGKQVIYGEKREDYCDENRHFDDCVFILGKEGFQTSFYFEVQVRGKTAWTLGVAKENIMKKGEVILKPEYGFWTVSKKNKLYSPSKSVLKRHKVKKVGVFVDYNDGRVLFYDVDAMSQICSYTHQYFSGKLFPIFSPGFNHDGKNAIPLIITPVPGPQCRQPETVGLIDEK
ncbi:hypothetical protein NFI96_011418 [Prochilodus magdalenae]|nr:hypothetical protein NFI96_011418 [Prochilodus magdalenae]